MSAMQSPTAALAATETLTFALRPPEAIASEIGRLTRRARELFNLKGLGVPTEGLHAPLAAVGPYDRVAVEAARRAMAAFQANRVQVTFDRMLTLKGGRTATPPLVLAGGDQLNGLKFVQKVLTSEMRRVGLVAASRAAFVPHLAMLYDRTVVPETPIDPITWTVNEIVLVHSFAGAGRHIDLERWPLL